jgi:large subunit ribosomal protein L19
MNNLVQKFEENHINKLVSNKKIPAFRPGDTIKITLKIVEGDKSRLQAYEGVCIARKNNSVNSKFTVRKMSHGEGVERVFPLFSPNIDKIEVIRKGSVKRAKLYYLRDRTGKSARIADRDRGDEADQYELNEIEKAPVAEKAITAEEKPTVEKESESRASKAEKTKDESK